MDRLPNFFLAGAPKAATTSLYHYLNQHPQIYMSPVKEPCFFASEIRIENFDQSVQPKISHSLAHVSNWDHYLSLFAPATTEHAVGEASVVYLWSETAPASIAARIPHAKILVILRDPAERAYSQYAHGRAAGFIDWSFREHLGRAFALTSNQFSVYHPFLELGLYARSLARYRKHFGQNVWIGFYEDFSGRPGLVYQEILRFLDIDENFKPDMSRRYLSGPGLPAIEPEDRRRLIEYYREDIQEVERITGRDLTAWRE